MAARTQIVRDCVVLNKLGLHARPASMFVQTATRFKSEITISNSKEGLVCDGKSIMGLLMLAAEEGTSISITAHGEDAKEALDALEKLITDKFGEE